MKIALCLVVILVFGLGIFFGASLQQGTPDSSWKHLKIGKSYEVLWTESQDGQNCLALIKEVGSKKIPIYISVVGSVTTGIHNHVNLDTGSGLKKTLIKQGDSVPMK